MGEGVVTAGMLVIGDEILSGRTKDRNIGFVAQYCTDIGIDLQEVRVVRDIEAAIVEAVNALRSRYDHVFTTGGIGPTHDDITADAIARAFGVAIGHNPRAVDALAGRYGRENLNEARLRMARIPEGADLIENAVSAAPGFSIGNVHVMAGVPSIMQAMMDALTPRLAHGRRMLSRTVVFRVGEGTIAAALATIQDQHREVLIGSYPVHDEGGYATHIVLRCRDHETLTAAEEAVTALAASVAVP